MFMFYVHQLVQQLNLSVWNHLVSVLYAGFHFVLLKCTNVAVRACLFYFRGFVIYMKSCSCRINMWLIFAIITNYKGILRHHEWHVYHIKSCSVNCNHRYETCAHAVHICMITFFQIFMDGTKNKSVIWFENDVNWKNKGFVRGKPCWEK